jgi:hypothetical protein
MTVPKRLLVGPNITLRATRSRIGPRILTTGLGGRERLLLDPRARAALWRFAVKHVLSVLFGAALAIAAVAVANRTAVGKKILGFA